MIYTVYILIFYALGDKMKINNCGYCYRHNSDFLINRPNGSGDCMILVLRSTACFYLDGKKHITNGPAAIVFEKGYPQIYGANDCEFINDWVHFEANENEIENLKRRGVRFNTLIELHNVSSLSVLIRNMCREMYSDNLCSTESALLYFELLFNKLLDLSNINSKYDKPSLFEKISRIKSNIYNNPQNNWNVKEIADSFFISLSYLQHSYKDFFGVSIKQDITNARIEHAKHLLFSTDYSVTNISRMCGYENDVHFMRIFKLNVGITPTNYRKNSLQSVEKIETSHQNMPFKI